MKQSDRAQEMIDLMDLVDQVDLAEDNQDMKGKAALPPMGAWGKPSASGPGTVNRGTPNDYTRDQVTDMLKFATKFISKNGKQLDSWKYGKEWLNSVGAGMKEFMTITKGSPNQEYKEATHGGDMLNGKYGGLSQNKADKGSASADLKGKATGNTTNKSTEDANILDITSMSSKMNKGRKK